MRAFRSRLQRVYRLFDSAVIFVCPPAGAKRDPRGPTHNNRFPPKTSERSLHVQQYTPQQQNKTKTLTKPEIDTQTYLCCCSRHPFSSTPPVRKKKRQEPMAQHKSLAFTNLVFGGHLNNAVYALFPATRHGMDVQPFSHERLRNHMQTIPPPKVHPLTTTATTLDNTSPTRRSFIIPCSNPRKLIYEHEIEDNIFTTVSLREGKLRIFFFLGPTPHTNIETTPPYKYQGNPQTR
ncbi:unnamed protein product [Ectocarpus sp. 8 AP-2014]